MDKNMNDKKINFIAAVNSGCQFRPVGWSEWFKDITDFREWIEFNCQQDDELLECINSDFVIKENEFVLTKNKLFTMVQNYEQKELESFTVKQVQYLIDVMNL